MRKRNKMMMLLLATTMVVSLAGCGAKKEEAATGGKKWVIATDTAFKPFEYKAEDGNYVGIDIDILDAIAKDQGFEYDLQVLGWDASIAACQAGQADGMIAGMTITDERKKTFDFSDGYFEDGQIMVVPSNSNITSIAELAK